MENSVMVENQSGKRNGKLTKYNKAFIEQRADPFIMRAEDGTYYFTASVPEYDRIVLRHSETLEGLKDAEEITIWKKHESGDMSQNVWAPELHYINGCWYIYFAASRADDIWRLRPYILSCEGQDPMKDSWIERGMIQRSDEDIYSFEAFSLDSTVFEHNGKYYYIWAEKVSVGIQISNLYIAEMESPLKLKTAQVLLTTPDYDWERMDIWVNEAPSVIKKNGKIFVVYSASATGWCYCMGMLSIDEDGNLLDPRSWKKEKEPVLRTNSDLGFYGPGHNSFVELPDGRDVCVYHARTYQEIEGDPLFDANRHVFLMVVDWDEHGYPIFDYKKNILTSAS